MAEILKKLGAVERDAYGISASIRILEKDFEEKTSQINHLIVDLFNNVIDPVVKEMGYKTRMDTWYVDNSNRHVHFEVFQKIWLDKYTQKLLDTAYRWDKLLHFGLRKEKTAKYIEVVLDPGVGFGENPTLCEPRLYVCPARIEDETKDGTVTFFLSNRTGGHLTWRVDNKNPKDSIKKLIQKYEAEFEKNYPSS